MREDIKEIQGGLSKLKYELQTDKKFTDLDGIGKRGIAFFAFIRIFFKYLFVYEIASSIKYSWISKN